MRPPRTARRRVVTTITAALLAALALAGCGDDPDEQGRASDAVDTTEEALEPEDQPDQDRVIDPGSGIAQVRVDDTSEDVERVLGEPDERATAEGELSGELGERLVFEDAAVEVVLDGDGGVTQVETTHEDARTESGVGIGSTQAEVETAYPEIACDAPTAGPVVCRLGAEAAGSLVTDFFVEGETVTRVVVGRIID